MANSAINRFQFFSSEADISSLIETCFHTDPYGLFCLDFERIRPLPPMLAEISQSESALGAAILLRGPVRKFGYESDVFDEYEVRSSGAKNFEELEAWARRERPHMLRAGERSIAAHQTTGFWNRDNWIAEVWGADALFESFEFLRREPGAVDLSFSTRISGPEGIFRAIAQRFPSAEIRASSLEEGNGYAYQLVAERGQITETRPEITEQLRTEVYGEAYRDEEAERFTRLEATKRRAEEDDPETADLLKRLLEMKAQGKAALRGTISLKTKRLTATPDSPQASPSPGKGKSGTSPTDVT